MARSDASAPASAAASAGAPAAGAARSTGARLAGLHLRGGALALARAELETLAGSGQLDDAALLDLAEARWRTDDLPGAGEAAAAYLATGREDVLALIIAAEATVALGRPNEARRLASRALERGDLPLETLFAGIARSAVWPVDPTIAAQAPATLFGAGGPAHPVGAARAAAPASPGLPDGQVSGGPGTSGQTLWTSTAGAPDPVPARLPDPALELDAARADLVAGRIDAAAVRLAVALRFGPALAPAVLDVAAGHAGPAMDLVRGDAYRLVGHERDARVAYAAAAGGLATTPGPTVVPGATSPEPPVDADPPATSQETS